MRARFTAAVAAAALGFAALAITAFDDSALAVELDPGLIARAKKEGRVVYYSTRQISTMRAMAAKFKERYGIELEYSRHSNEDLVRKIVSEYSTKVPTADVFDASTGFAFLLKENMVEQYKVEEAAAFDPAARDADNYWVASNVYVGVLAYNTSLVKPEDVPKSIDDALNPKWANRKIVFTTQYNAGGILGLIGGLEIMRGQPAAKEYVRKLRALNPLMLDASPSAATDALAAGQAAVCIGCLNQHIFRAVEKGAPVAWIPTIQPIIAYYGHAGIVKNQKNPNAARLFVEWLSSEEGQLLNEAEFALGPRPGLGTPMEPLKPRAGKFTAISVTPKMINEDMPRWQKVFEDNLR